MTTPAEPRGNTSRTLWQLAVILIRLWAYPTLLAMADTAKRSVTLMTTTWKEIDDLAKANDEISPAELIRQIILRGLRLYKSEVAKGLELETKQLVQQKLKQRQGSMTEALETLKSKVDGKDADAAQAIAALERGLTD